MRKFFRWIAPLEYPLAVALLFLGLILWWQPQESGAQPTAIGPANPILCNNVIGFTATAGSVAAVPSVAGKTLVVCGWEVTAAAASTFSFGFSTVAACASGITNQTGTLNVNVSAVTDHSPTAVLSYPTGTNFCATAGAAAIAGLVWFAQF